MLTVNANQLATFVTFGKKIVAMAMNAYKYSPTILMR
jgi:hypothetical protein